MNLHFSRNRDGCEVNKVLKLQGKCAFHQRFYVVKTDSYVINALKFINVVTPEGIPNPDVHNLFVESAEEFAKGFALLVENAYRPLFDLHGDTAWALERTGLMRFFRQEDKSTETVGKRQAETFIRFAEISGRREPNTANGNTEINKREQPKRAVKPNKKVDSARTNASLSFDSSNNPKELPSSQAQGFSLAVRIEVNLPANAEQSTYDAIFKSIRENLINSE